MGGMNDDHLYLAAKTPLAKDTTLAGGIPDIHNSAPLGVIGNVSANGTDECVGTFPPGAKISLVLQSDAGLRLEVLDGGNNVIASSDRGGQGVEEALQLSAPGGPLTVRITNDQPKNARIDGYVLEMLSRSND